MRLKCVICGDELTVLSDIYSTNCGHLFHNDCLKQWTARSKTCAQCRSRTTPNTVHKIYISLDETLDCEDSGLLQNKIDDLELELQKKKAVLKKTEEKNSSLEEEVSKLCNDVVIKNDKVGKLKTITNTLRDEISQLKTQTKQLPQLEKEVDKLKNELKNAAYVQLAVTGSLEEVNDLMKENCDPHSLTILVSALKRELLDYKKQQKRLNTTCKEYRSKLSSSNLEIDTLRKQNAKLLSDKEADLSKPSCDFNSTIGLDDIDNSIQIINDCSPPKSTDNTPSITSPIVILDSPYSTIKSAPIGLYNLKKSKQPQMGQLKKNTFTTKYPNKKQDMVKGVVSYDGFGRPGETFKETFSTNRTAVKRTKPQKNTNSTKFKKLARVASQTVLTEFLEN